jgi:hypothetical protein
MEQFKFIGHFIYFVFSYGTVSVYRTYFYFVFSYGTAGLPKPYKIVCIFFLGITQFQNDSYKLKLFHRKTQNK